MEMYAGAHTIGTFSSASACAVQSEFDVIWAYLSNNP